MKHFIYYLPLIVLIASCGSDKNTTPSGINVTFFTEGADADKLVSGNILEVKAHYRTEDGQRIIQTNPGEPAYLQFDSSMTVETGGLVQEVFEILKVGDSAYFEIPAKNLWEVTFRRPLPDSVREDAMVLIDLKIDNQMTFDEYREFAMQKERDRNAAQFEAEMAALTSWLEEKNIEAEISESGLMYQVNETTNGQYPSNGDIVTVAYKGMLLDGSVFDQGDYTFPLGQGQVIAGWDEGIGYLRKGEKGVLYIPSQLGYGSRGSGARIPPYSSLVFEVELVEIKKNENAD